MFEVGGPEAFWLNVTNIGLGAVTLVCVLVIGASVVAELVARWQRRAVEADDHAFAVPGLGLTMADGGERLEKPKAEERPE
jgi:hypothetical protein